MADAFGEAAAACWTAAISSPGPTGLTRWDWKPDFSAVAVFVAGVGGEGDGGDRSAVTGRQIADGGDQAVAVFPRHGDVADEHIRPLGK